MHDECKECAYEQVCPGNSEGGECTGKYIFTEKDEAEKPAQADVPCSELLSSAGFMHPKELQKLAIKLGNGQWCRHWYQWGLTTNPWIMALQVRGVSGSPVGCDDLKAHGFVRGDSCLYFINRADEYGLPYRG